MSLVSVLAGNRQVEIERVASAAQVSTNDPAVVAGSALDMRGWRSLAYTILCAANTISWSVYGANAADYSDEVIVEAGV